MSNDKNIIGNGIEIRDQGALGSSAANGLSFAVEHLGAQPSVSPDRLAIYWHERQLGDQAGASELTADELLEMQEHVAEREMDEHLLGIVHPSAEQRRLHRHNECDGACARVAHRLSH